MRPPLVTCLVFALIACSCANREQEPSPVQSAINEIRPEAIRSHIRYLADDLLEGRGTGTRGYLLAAKYVAAQFETMSIHSAGVDGGYFQPVTLRKAEVVKEQTTVFLVRDGRRQALSFGKDFIAFGDTLRTESSVSAPAVFAGFGITAPELNYDDYLNVEVRGRLVVILTGAPPSFSATQRAHYSSGREKAENASRHGAVGIVSIITPDDEKSFPWAERVRFASRGAMRWTDRSGAPHGVFPEIRVEAIFNASSAEQMFDGARKSLQQALEAAKQSASQSFSLPVSLDMRRVSRHQELESPNVIGLLPGSDPKLSGEYVVFTAHLDHEGIGEPQNGDVIYNGALDNASGVASMLEIARAFSRLPQPPPRSVLFVAVTGEEEGLLGSDYFANNPTVNAAGMIANINLDGTALLYPIRDVVALGSEHSTLDQAVRRAAAEMHVEVSPDFAPEEVFFIRSDQYSFVRKGIPAIFVYQGLKSADAQVDGAKVFNTWMQTIYHTPRDDFRQPMDFESAVREAGLDFLIGYYVASNPSRPQWNPDDFFGSKYASSR